MGWQGDGSASPEDAVVWDLTDLDLEPESVPAPDLEDAEMREATSINDKATFQVVGWFVDDQNRDRGFVWTDGDEFALSLGPAPDAGVGAWVDSRALAINNESNALIGGTSFEVIQLLDCEEPAGDATYWLRNSAPTSGTELEQSEFEVDDEDLGGEARGVNDGGSLAGMGIECVGNSRLPRALY